MQALIAQLQAHMGPAPLARREGQTMVEYVVILAVIVVILIVGFIALGGRGNTVLQDILDALG